MQFLLLFLPLLAHAFRLDPMVNSLTVDSNKASGTFAVENTTKTKVAMQFEVRGRSVSLDGKEERPAVEGFLVYPEQLSLEPGEKRSVRVAWTGEKPEKELAFRFIASQLPVDFQKAEGKKVKLKFLLEYVASLYLTPPTAKPKLKVVKYSLNPQHILEVQLSNEGSAHQLLERAKFVVKENGKEIPLPKEQIQELRTENILAGSQRLLKIALPKTVKKPSFDLAIE